MSSDGHLAKSCPEASARYRKLLGAAADLHWRRNLVAHGHYLVTFPPAGTDAPSFWAEGTHKGKPVRLSIDETTLDKLWHDIAHLVGELRATANTHGTAGGWPEVFSDTDLLRIHRESMHPWNPDPDKRPTNPAQLQGDKVDLRPAFPSLTLPSGGAVHGGFAGLMRAAREVYWRWRQRLGTDR